MSACRASNDSCVVVSRAIVLFFTEQFELIRIALVAVLLVVPWHRFNPEHSMILCLTHILDALALLWLALS
jgi:hypothetical protein